MSQLGVNSLYPRHGQGHQQIANMLVCFIVNKNVFNSYGKNIVISVNVHYHFDRRVPSMDKLHTASQTFTFAIKGQMPFEALIAFRFKRYLPFDQEGNNRVQILQCFLPFNAFRCPWMFTVLDNKFLLKMIQPWEISG